MTQVWRAWDGLKHFAFLALGAFVGMAMWSTVSTVPTAMPSYYTQWFPIIQFGYVDKATGSWEAPVQDLFRDHDKVCWSLFSEKLREGRVVGYRFRAQGGEASEWIPTAAYLAHDDNSPDKGKVLESHKVGAQWHRRWCFDLADRFPDFRAITIEGQAEHDRFPHFWKTITPTPTFTVAP